MLCSLTVLIIEGETTQMQSTILIPAAVEKVFYNEYSERVVKEHMSVLLPSHYNLMTSKLAMI